jgi:GTP 3',8-cyclase
MSHWKILRILVSDACNYHCVFCHNEGQGNMPRSDKHFMRFQDFVAVVEALQGEGISEAQFSGGEPFTNPHVLDMIEFANSHTAWEIGCATNAQLINEQTVTRLSQTRVKLNINVPSLREDVFGAATGGGSLASLSQKLSLMSLYGVDYAFNTVLRPGFMSDLLDMVGYVADRGRRLKILPYLDVSQPCLLDGTETLFHHLGLIAEYHAVFPTAQKWVLKDRGMGHAVIKYVDFPCYRQDIDACRHYAEIRLLPDMFIQPCLVNPQRRYTLGGALTKSPRQVRDRFEAAWTTFTAC